MSKPNGIPSLVLSQTQWPSNWIKRRIPSIAPWSFFKNKCHRSVQVLPQNLSFFSPFPESTNGPHVWRSASLVAYNCNARNREERTRSVVRFNYLTEILSAQQILIHHTQISKTLLDETENVFEEILEMFGQNWPPCTVKPLSVMIEYANFLIEYRNNSRKALAVINSVVRAHSKCILFRQHSIALKELQTIWTRLMNIIV